MLRGRPPPNLRKPEVVGIFRSPPEFRVECFLFSALQSISYETPYPGWGPFVQVLPQLYANTLQNSALQLALRAVAFYTAGRSPEHRQYASFGSHLYGSALREVQRAVLDPVQVNSNETLMATLLLSVYEVSHRKQEHRQTTDTLQSAINHQLVYKQEVITAIMSMVVLLY